MLHARSSRLPVREVHPIFVSLVGHTALSVRTVLPPQVRSVRLYLGIPSSYTDPQVLAVSQQGGVESQP